MLKDIQKKFVELWANKDKLGLTADQVALEIGVSKKTLYNWLKDKEITEEVNKIAVANLDAVIPKLASQTEKLINSNKSSDIKLGMESFFRIKDQLEAKENLNNKSLEMQKFERGCEILLKHREEIFGHDELGKRLFLQQYVTSVLGAIRGKSVTEAEVNKFLAESVIVEYFI